MRKLTLITVSISIAGCISVTPISMTQTSKAQLRGETIAFAKSEKSQLSAVTHTNRSLGLLLGSAAMYAEGDRLIAENGILDPILLMKTELISAFSNALSMKTIDSPIEAKEDDAAVIAGNFSGVARFVIDIKPLDWAYTGVKVSPSEYRIGYAAKIRIVDTQSKQLIMQMRCFRNPFDKNFKAYSYDELLANQAAALKRETSAIVQECAKTILHDLSV